MDNENAAFWLPTHFLTDDDTTDTHINDFDKDYELLAELTHKLGRSTLRPQPTTHPTSEWMFSTSPQSTLTGFGPFQDPSPPLTPPGTKNDAAWELLFEAAEQVARLRMNAIAAQLNQAQNRGLLSAPSHQCKPPHHHHHVSPIYDSYPRSTQCEGHSRVHQPRRSCGGAPGGSHSAWSHLKTAPPQYRHQSHTHGMSGPGSNPRTVFSGSDTAPKRQSTGTGVFIPRRFDGPQSRSHPDQPREYKKPSSVVLPARVVQTSHLDLDEINNDFHHNSNPKFGTRLLTDREIFLARRNALMNQHKRSFRQEGNPTMAGHDIRLPSDWTY